MADLQIWRLLLLVSLLIEVCVSLQWTGTVTLAGNSSIPACHGQDVTLAWDYVKNPDEHIVDVEWRFRRDDGSAEEVIATQVNGNFYADPAATRRVQFIPGAGIRLLGVTDQYTGTYSVQVNLNVHGSIVTHTQSIKVVVTNEPITTTGQLEAHFKGARYMNNTQQHQLMLSCGKFNSLWSPGVDVLWTLPDGSSVPSSYKDNGQFVLAVPNPFQSGEYTCNIDPASPVTLCMSVESPLTRGATVIIDQTEGSVALLDSQLQLVNGQMNQMEGQIQGLEHNETDLSNQLGQILQGVDPNQLNLSSTLIPLVHGSGAIRVVGGHGPSDGRVEMLVGGVWGTVCDDNWTVLEARVACRELGYPSSNPRSYTAGGGSGPIHLDEVNCVGTEVSLLDCRHQPIDHHNCGHEEDAGVDCSSP